MATLKSIALIPAAGMGKRMGASVNKQYLQLHGMPIIARTIAVFENSPHIDAIYLIIPAEEIAYCQEHIVDAHGFKKIAALIPGGKERQHSVFYGLKAMRASVCDEDIVLIHDGVRPLISERLLLESINAARQYDGALVAVPAKDTIKTVDNGIVSGTPARDSLWQAQTPQSFRFGKIYNAYLTAATDGFACTDDAALIEHAGGSVHIIRGDYRNIKITTPEDLLFAAALLTTITHGDNDSLQYQDLQEQQTPQQKTDDFISTFSHDLKNPLTAAVGSIDIVREGCLGTVNEEQEGYLQSAIDSCNEVVTMIDNVQDIRKFELGKMQMSLQPCNIRELISKIAERHVRSAKHEGISIAIDVEPDVPDVLVDRCVFNRVIGNLLDNALTVTPEGAAIVVTCRSVAGKARADLEIPEHAALPSCFFENSRFIRISVCDTGEGIPTAELDRIFDRTATSAHISGRGKSGVKLGLTFCKLAITHFHGAIWAESCAEQGGKFIILLPAVLPNLNNRCEVIHE